MDVDSRDYRRILPTVLKHISTAHFISFDLELSGIPVNRRSRESQTVQDRYAEVKEAAEKFHILQFGITCVEQDDVDRKYIFRTFNFDLSPLVSENFGVDREFTYSSSAIQFLLRQGYDTNAPFKNGIPYLSHLERQTAREHLEKEFDMTKRSDMVIRKHQQDILGLQQRVRDEIAEWVKTQEPNPHMYIFDDVGSGMQRAMIHQTIRKEFPHLRTSTTNHGHTVLVLPKDEDYDARELARAQERINGALFYQNGFSTVADAIKGVDLSEFDFMACDGQQIRGDREANASPEAFKQRMQSILATLAQKPKVIVGHNCFLDLVYIWHTFYGQLPDTVDEFASLLHREFPLVLDTKYIVTADPLYFDSYCRMQLGDLDRVFHFNDKTVVEFAHESKEPSLLNAVTEGWNAGGGLHQAGYDSMITAQVFLKLVARFREQGPTSSDASPSTISVADDEEAEKDNGSEWQENLPPVNAKRRKKKSNGNSKANSTSSAPNPVFSNNTFGALTNLTTSPPAISASAETPTSSSATESADSLAATMQNMTISSKSRKKSRKNGNMLMPSWSDSWWLQYANTLRVFGTEEQQLELKPMAVSRGSEQSQNEGGVTLETEEEEKPVQGGRRSSLLGALSGWLYK